MKFKVKKDDLPWALFANGEDVILEGEPLTYDYEAAKKVLEKSSLKEPELIEELQEYPGTNLPEMVSKINELVVAQNKTITTFSNLKDK